LFADTCKQNDGVMILGLSPNIVTL
jgi:hypothetical protein